MHSYYDEGTYQRSISDLLLAGGGDDLSRAETSREAIAGSSLDFQVEQWPIMAFKPTGGLTPLVLSDASVRSPWLMNVRPDTDPPTGLSLVSEQYRVFQNSEVLDVLDSVIRDGDARYVGAGTFKGGRECWAVCKVANDFAVGTDDRMQTFALALWGHGNGEAIRMIPLEYRLVCTNSLIAGGKLGRGFSIWHRGGHDEMVTSAQGAISQIGQVHQRLADQSTILAGRVMSADDRRDYFDQLFPTRVSDDDAITVPSVPTEREADKNLGILEHVAKNFNDPMNATLSVAGTAWAAYNAVSYWADHVRTAPGRTDDARLQNRLRSTWLGPAADVKRRAWDAALALAT